MVRRADIDAADRFLTEAPDAGNYAATGASAEKGSSGKPPRMDDETIEALIAGELIDAVRFVDLELGVERARATAAYRGDPYGDEEDGRSTMVSRDVHDTVQGQLPDLIRILLGPERICEYAPMQPGDEAWTDQATQYAEYVIERDNDGFTILYSAIKDALIRKTGVVKFWWDEHEEVKTEHYSGLDELALFVLQQDGEIEELEVEEDDMTAGNTAAGPDGQPVQLYNVTVKRRIKTGRVKLYVMPPEEYLIDRRARSLEDFTLQAHRSMKTVSELVSLGYDEDMVREFVTSPELDTNIEYIERQPYARAVGSFDALNPATQRVLYVESYAWIDTDGDGIAELWKCCTMGPSYTLVHREAVDHVPFAAFHVDPEPHTFFGLSTYDKTADIQRVKTLIQRNMLDSLAQSIHPRMTVVEGQVNYDDVLNNEVGGVIRQRAVGMVQPLDTPFVGQQAMPVLDYLDSTREMRTGVSRMSLGLAADELQSTAEAGIEQSVTGSQGKIELIARIMANGMRQLYAGILHLIVQNQDRPRMILLNGQFVPMDPRTWNTDVGVKINVTSIVGSVQQKLQSLTWVIAKQELILTTMGMNQPIVTPAQYAGALKRFVELSGWRNSDAFFTLPPPDWKPEPPPPPPPDPKVEIARMQFELEQQKLEWEKQKGTWQEERERDRMVGETILRKREMDMRYKSSVEAAAINAAGNENAAVTNLQAEELRQDNENDRELAAHLVKLHETKAKLDSQERIAERSAQVAEKKAAQPKPAGGNDK